MKSKAIKTNLRERLLCRSSFEDFMAEYSGSNDYYVDGGSACEQLKIVSFKAEHVREKIQLFYLFRKENCETPDFGDKDISGIVIEFGTNSGVDALAVYSDLRGAWFSGENNSLSEFIISGHAVPVYKQLRDAADRRVLHTASDPSDVPSPPPPGFILMSFLSKSGISFGGGASRDVASDRFGGPIIHAALQMRKLILGVN